MEHLVAQTQSVDTLLRERFMQAIEGANAEEKLVAFDLMAYLSDDCKVARAEELLGLGVTLISCHTGWCEQAAGKTPNSLIAKVCHRLKDTSAQIIAMGGLKPSSVKNLKSYIEQNQIFALAVGSAITRSDDPNAEIAQFKQEINQLHGSTRMHHGQRLMNLVSIMQT